jgi:hypothetical protein
LYSQARSSVRKAIDRVLTKLQLRQEPERAAARPVVFVPKFLREKLFASPAALEGAERVGLPNAIPQAGTQVPAQANPVLQIEGPRAAPVSAAALADEELLGEEVISNA